MSQKTVHTVPSHNGSWKHLQLVTGMIHTVGVKNIHPIPEYHFTVKYSPFPTSYWFSKLSWNLQITLNDIV